MKIKVSFLQETRLISRIFTEGVYEKSKVIHRFIPKTVD